MTEPKLQCSSCNGTYVKIVATIVHFNRIESLAHCEQCGVTIDLPVEGIHIAEYQSMRDLLKMPQRALIGRTR